MTTENKKDNSATNLIKNKTKQEEEEEDNI